MRFYFLLLFLPMLANGQESPYCTFTFQYQRNKRFTQYFPTDTNLRGANLYINNVTYLINRPNFNLGLGIGISSSKINFQGLNYREVHIPLSFVQKINIDKLLYIRYSISKNILLSSQRSLNGKDYKENFSFKVKDPVAVDIVLGTMIKEKVLFEIGYAYRTFSADPKYNYGKNQFCVGLGFFLR